MSDSESAAQKDALLEAILPDVVFDGWSQSALTRAAAQLGIDETALDAILPGGAVELARWLDDWADRQMIAALETHDLAALRTHQRLILGIRLRLEALAPYREAVRRAIVLNTPPFAVTRAPQAVYRTVDALWYCAGDTATDFNFYTKRALLAAVYTATVLYWLDDRTEGLTDTWDFLDRRIADVLAIPKLTGTIKRRIRGIFSPFKPLNSEA
jgi:ubiquinone biosynthesis protein COQ9